MLWYVLEYVRVSHLLCGFRPTQPITQLHVAMKLQPQVQLTTDWYVRLK